MGSQQRLEERVARAAEAAIADHQYVSAIDVLAGIGWLAPVHVKEWRQGRVPSLEGVMQCNPRKITAAMRIFREWAELRGLKPIETAYLEGTRSGRRELQFSVSGDADIERAYRTHYVSPELSDKKRQKLGEKLSRPPELVVFWTVSDSQCAECGAELFKGRFLFLEAGKPLCLECADLGHLVFLPRGDTALTRRARQHSRLSAVVVRFSRARKRYERQGLLVEEEARARAEEECTSDAEVRAARREREAAARADEDQEFAAGLAARILELFPGCSPEEARAIARHAGARGSGRVARSAAGRQLEAEPVTLAVTAWVRHRHTDYDERLMQTQNRTGAREQVRERVEEILESWRERGHA